MRSGYRQGLRAHAFLADGGDTPGPGPPVVLVLWSCGDGHVVSFCVPGLLGSPHAGAASCRGMRPSARQLQRRPCQQCGNTQPTPAPTCLRLKASSSASSGGAGQSGAVLADSLAPCFLRTGFLLGLCGVVYGPRSCSFTREGSRVGGGRALDVHSTNVEHLLCARHCVRHWR